VDAIPFRREPNPPARDTRSDPPTPTVLVVDDSRFVRASLVRGLAPRFRLQQADSGERAWELLLLDPSIGAVLSDLSMPGMDGFELLRRVRGSMLDRVRTLPFAVLSGADDAAQRARAQELGADRFVVKGDAVETLGDWIASRLAGRVAEPAPGASATVPATAIASVTARCTGRTGSVEGIERAGSAATPPADAASAAPRAAAATAPTSSAPTSSAPASSAPATFDPATFDPATFDPASCDPASFDPAAVATPGHVAPPDPVTPPDDAVSRPDAAEPRDPPTPGPMPRLVPDPLQRWFQSAIGRPAGAGDPPPALLRLHAPGLEDLPARLRRGVRAADALHLGGGDTAWLCVPASGPLAVRLALRFGLLAAGRLAVASGPAARVGVCLQGVDPARPAEALAALQALPPAAAPAAGLALRTLAGPWGPAWQCTLPWPAVRLLVAG
jgi:CheY-like chemotaxis protein